MNTERTVTYAVRAESPEDVANRVEGRWVEPRFGEEYFCPDHDDLGRRFLVHVEDVTPEPEPWYTNRDSAWVGAMGGRRTAEVGFHMEYPGVTILSATQPSLALRDELFAARDLLVKHGLME